MRKNVRSMNETWIIIGIVRSLDNAQTIRMQECKNAEECPKYEWNLNPYWRSQVAGERSDNEDAGMIRFNVKSRSWNCKPFLCATSELAVIYVWSCRKLLMMTAHAIRNEDGDRHNLRFWALSNYDSSFIHTSDILTHSYILASLLSERYPATCDVKLEIYGSPEQWTPLEPSPCAHWAPDVGNTGSQRMDCLQNRLSISCRILSL